MHCTDPRDVVCLADAFDLTTTDILQWELELVWRAVELGVIELSQHAERAAADDTVPTAALFRVIRQGLPRSKDIGMTDDRRPGINFEGKLPGRRWIRIKVSWRMRYVIVTVHTL
jgi:hypothetical protein